MPVAAIRLHEKKSEIRIPKSSNHQYPEGRAALLDVS